MRKGQQRKAARVGRDDLATVRRIADEALRTAGNIGSMIENVDPSTTGEMRTVLGTLLATEQAVTDLARRYITQRAS